MSATKFLQLVVASSLVELATNEARVSRRAVSWLHGKKGHSYNERGFCTGVFQRKL